MKHFGERLRERRAELRLSLRDFALRAAMDPGNLSRIERGRVPPPQDPEILDRITAALELLGTPDGESLRDLAATENGLIPNDIMTDAQVMSALPLLLRTVKNKQLDDDAIERLVQMIKDA